MAPEILRCQQYGPEVDLWSVGTVVYEMLVGKPPFRAQNHVELLVRIDKGEDRIRFPGEREGVGGVSESLKELCRDLLKKDPKDRMTFQKFFAHPCVQEETTPPSHPESAQAIVRRHSSASDRGTPPRSPMEEQNRGTVMDYFTTTRGGNPIQQSPSHDPTVNLPTQARRLSPPYDVTGPPLQHRRVSLTSQRPPLNVDTRTSPALQHGTSPSSRYAPELERNPSLRSNSGNLGTSGGRASPGSSYLQQRYRPRTPEENPVAPGTASLEVDYVLVESRQAVEVNALADELAYSPQQRTSGDKLPRYNALIKRGTSYAIGNTGTSPVATTTQVRNPVRGGLTSDQRSVSAPVYTHVPGSQSPSPTGQGYIPSERRFGTSPSSALAKAISMASMKLFGASSPSPPYLQSYNHPNDRGTMVKAGGGLEEESAVREIEEVALRSNVVYQFAEMKLSQIIPTSSSSGGGGVPSSPSSRRNSWKNSILTDEADATLCSEALALYVKSLTLLQKSMDLAARYWQRRGGTGVASARLNNAVQWGRERFNETLEKADFVKSKIPRDAGESHIAPEKLIYDRALEMV